MFTDAYSLKNILIDDNSFDEEIPVLDSELDALRDLVTDLESKLIIARQALHALKDMTSYEDKIYVIDAALERIDGLYAEGKAGTA